MGKTYIGVATSQHDPALAVVDESGEVLFAEALERSAKNKRAWNMVPDHIGFIEPLIKRYVGDNAVVLSASWSEGGLKWSPFIFFLTYLKKKFLSADNFIARENSSLRQAMYKAPSSLKHMFLNIEHRLRWHNPRTSLIKSGVDHHLAHAYTAAYTSDFDDALCVILDGMGEGSSYAVFEMKKGKLKRLTKRGGLNMASLGLFYGSICEACGFDPIKGEEWKVMGLAPYGKKDAKLYTLMSGMIQVDGMHLKRARSYGAMMDEVFKKAKKFQSSMDAADMAFTAQMVFEEKTFALLNNIWKKHPCENLVLGGGCALNSSCNGKITEYTNFKRLHVPMCPGDDGNALGAALAAWHRDYPQAQVPRCKTPYLGSEISADRKEALCKFSGLESEIFSDENELCERVAKYLSQGKIVGWAQGKAEFGPRALGNRSILADPRKESIKDEINAKVKFREEFRPFAPSILEERAAEYFEKNEASPYMERTLKWKKFDAPGTVHFNQTGRLQTVSKKLNPRYHKLISKFEEITGVPVLLNTSFNVMGRPIVHDIEDAVGVFFLSGIDILVVENTIFYKPSLREGY